MKRNSADSSGVASMGTWRQSQGAYNMSNDASIMSGATSFTESSSNLQTLPPAKANDVKEATDTAPDYPASVCPTWPISGSTTLMHDISLLAHFEPADHEVSVVPERFLAHMHKRIQRERARNAERQLMLPESNSMCLCALAHSRRQSLPHTIQSQRVDSVTTFGNTAGRQPCEPLPRIPYSQTPFAAMSGTVHNAADRQNLMSADAVQQRFEFNEADGSHESNTRTSGKKVVKHAATLGSNDEETGNDKDDFSVISPACVYGTDAYDALCLSTSMPASSGNQGNVELASRRMTANQKLRLSRKRSLMLKQKSLPSFLETVEEEGTVSVASTDDRRGSNTHSNKSVSNVDLLRVCSGNDLSSKHGKSYTSSTSSMHMTATATTTDISSAAASASAYSDGSTSLLSSVLSVSSSFTRPQDFTRTKAAIERPSPSVVTEWLQANESAEEAEAQDEEQAEQRRHTVAIEADDGSLSPLSCLPACNASFLLRSPYASAENDAAVADADAESLSSEARNDATAHRLCTDNYAQTDDAPVTNERYIDCALPLEKWLPLQQHECISLALRSMCDNCQKVLVDTCSQWTQQRPGTGAFYKCTAGAFDGENGRECDTRAQKSHHKPDARSSAFSAGVLKLSHAKTLPVITDTAPQRSQRAKRWLTSRHSHVSSDEGEKQSSKVAKADNANEATADKNNESNRKSMDESIGNVFEMLMGSFDAAINAIGGDASAVHASESELQKVVLRMPHATKVQLQKTANCNEDNSLRALTEAKEAILTDIQRLDEKFKELRDVRCESPNPETVEQLLLEMTAQQESELPVRSSRNSAALAHSGLDQFDLHSQRHPHSYDTLLLTSAAPLCKQVDGNGNMSPIVHQTETENEYAEIDSEFQASANDLYSDNPYSESHKLFEDSQRVYERVLRGLDDMKSVGSATLNGEAHGLAYNGGGSHHDWLRIQQLLNERISTLKNEFYNEIAKLHGRLSSIQAMRANLSSPATDYYSSVGDLQFGYGGTARSVTTETHGRQSYFIRSISRDSDENLLELLQAEIDSLRAENLSFRKRLLSNTISTIGRTLVSVNQECEIDSLPSQTAYQECAHCFTH